MSPWEKLKNWLYGSQVTPAPVIAPAIITQHGTGALIDTRSEQEKEGDIHFGEVVGTLMADHATGAATHSGVAAVNWVAKAVAAWRKFPVFNQNGTGACVAFTMAKILGILRWLSGGIFVPFSMGHIYIRRSNSTTQGMIGTEAFAIAAQGVTLDAITPSQNLSEAAINALKVPDYGNEIAALFKLSNAAPVILPNGDLETVASVIQTTGKPVMVWYYFTYAEWQDMPVVADPTMTLSDPRSLLHSVTAVDFTMYNGKKALIIEDSWGKFGQFDGQRVITEDWHKARNWFAAYPLNLKRIQAVGVTTLPQHTFTKPLAFIPWSASLNQPADMALHQSQLADVQALQGILQAMTDARGNSYFPLNAQCSGYYGALTAQAVYLWQSDNKVAAQDVLDALAGKRFGESSIPVMNKELLA